MVAGQWRHADEVRCVPEGKRAGLMGGQVNGEQERWATSRILGRRQSGRGNLRSLRQPSLGGDGEMVSRVTCEKLKN